jgi:hypothetical protein
MANFSAAEVVASGRAKPEPSAPQAAAVPRVETAAWDAARAPQQVAQDAAGVPPRVAAAWAVAAVPQRVAEVWAVAEVLQPEVAGWAAAEQRQEAALASAAVPRRVALPSVGLPSAAAWACRRDRVLPSPVPQPAARFAHAMERPRIALP